MEMVVMTSPRLYQILDEVEWDRELELIRDYMLVSGLKDISEFSYVALNYLYSNLTEGLVSLPLYCYMNLNFTQKRLDHISSYFLDEIIVLIETGHNTPYTHVEMDTFYDHLIEFCGKIMDKMFTNNSQLKRIGYVSCEKGALICAVH